jgi:hypothetical protein
MNDGRSTNCKVGFRSAETWGIVGVLFAAGVAIGFPLGMMWERSSAEQRISALNAAYAEALSAKDESIHICIAKATEAANKAETAVEKATEQAK